MRGFSLAEVLVSLGILVMAVVALFNLAGSAIKMSSKTEHLVIAGDIAEQQLNRHVSLAKLDQPAGTLEDFWETDSPDSPWKKGTIQVNGTKFQYEVFVQTVKDAQSGDDLGTVTATANRVKKVDTVVWWMVENSDQQRQGFGKLTASASRLVNEEPPEE